MRAIAYLSHALALRQAPASSSPIVPIATTVPPLASSAACAPTIGSPGNLYICGKDTSAANCKYWKAPEVSECRDLGGDFVNPALVGPDPGGHCHLYSKKGCADADEVTLLAPGAEAPLPVPGKPNKIICPGVTRANIPPNVAVAIKCFNVMDHPSASTGVPDTGVTANQTSPAAVLPPAQTPPPANTPPPGCTAPPANVNATAALAIRQTNVTLGPPTLLQTNPAPDPCKCVPGAGHPGAVYMCRNDLNPETPIACQWYDVPGTRYCQALPMPAENMTFIGPDFGGSCSFFSTGTCDRGTEVPIMEAAGQKSIGCPGVKLTQGAYQSKAVALKCWGNPQTK